MYTWNDDSLPRQQIIIESQKNNIRATSQDVTLMYFADFQTDFAR